VAAGIVFTVPGILFLNQRQGLDIAWPNPWLLGLLTSIAGVLGVLLSMPLKYTFIDEEELPYPAGTAGAELLKLGGTGGRQLFLIILIGSAAAIFALVRDVYFPAGFTIAPLTALGIFIMVLPLPLAVGGGYILGPRVGFSWLVGAALGWLILIPVLFQKGFEFGSAKAFTQNLGMGMVLGSGIGFFFGYIIPQIKNIFAPILKARQGYLRLFPWVTVLSVVGLYAAGVPFLAVILTILGVWLMVAVAARMTGETNIDPLEQFGIFVGLVIAFIYKYASLELGLFASFIIVTFVSVATAIAGDAGHDYKSAAIVGTRFLDIIKVDLIAVVFAGFAAPFVLESIRKGFAETLFTPVMPAPQAQLVAGSIFGFQYPMVFAAGFALAFLGEITNRFLPDKYKNKLLLMPMGIGLFLGLGLAIPIAIGALIRAYLDRNFSHLYHAGLLIAAGIMGGEGIAGFSAGALTSLGLSYEFGASMLLVVFLIFLVISLKLYLSKPGEKQERG
jgi:uncharacterized oligopeptide transporter (OPT) family protein